MDLFGTEQGAFSDSNGCFRAQSLHLKNWWRMKAKQRISRNQGSNECGMDIGEFPKYGFMARSIMDTIYS